MGIVNNISSNMILGELHKNTKKKSKASAQLALGEKIRNAGDDASGYAISEKMRVRIRALDQDEANVKNGASMLKTAEGAIQSQINLLRTIKEKVIDAHNDTNTDTDRMIIQKEITNYYEEINDIAAETTFNKKLLLLGNTVQETVKSWMVLDHAELVEGSDSLKLIPDMFDTLDTEPGPFATFGSASDDYPYDGYNLKPIKATEIPGYDEDATTTASYSKLHGGTANSATVRELNLALSSADVSGLNNTAFKITYGNGYSATYALTTDSSKTYSSNYTINISGMNKTQVAEAIASKVNSTLGSYYTASASGEKVTFTTKTTGEITSLTSKWNVTGTTLSGGTVTSGVDRPESPATGLGSFSLSGGKDAETHPEDRYDPVTDKTTTVTVIDKPATYASVTKDISGVSAGSGITLTGKSSYGSTSTGYLVFLDDDSEFKPNSLGYYTVGKNYSGSKTLNMSYMTVKVSGGKLTLTANYAGVVGNSDRVSDKVPASSSSTTTYTAASSLAGFDLITAGTDGVRAYWDWDLSAYNVSAPDKAEELVDKLLGKAFVHSNYDSSSDSYRAYKYEFIDSDKSPSLDSIGKLDSSTKLDLSKVRSDVESGKTVAEAVAGLIKSKTGSMQVYDSVHSKYIPLVETIKNSSDEITGIKFQATVAGKDGNNQYIAFREGDLRDYTIDFASAFSSMGVSDGNIASTLDGKGVRFYCATDPSQWVNLQFVNGISPADDDRPASGTGNLDIKTFVVDVSDVTDVTSLVKTIYAGDGEKNPQGLADWLKNEYKHMFQLAADYDKGTITIYDNRFYRVLDNPSYRKPQEKGAKIADGVLDNVIQDVRYVYVNDLVIHHTDRSSANIHVRIPQTTMDHIFGYKVGTYSLDDYSVLTSEKREKLLGSDGPPKIEGTLDKGLQYLIDANTLIGAQIVHMESAEANIVTDSENTTAAESVIRDADMAKSSLELATAQILSQSSQAMLSQSNQNSSSVLSLLQ